MTNTDLVQRWQTSMDTLPLIAILRGLTPSEALDVGSVLIESGFRLLEVPLNSPDPFHSIELLAREFGTRAIIGAGTVLESGDVTRTVNAGGNLIIAPNLDLHVAATAVEKKTLYCPGIATPSEAFTALNAGATAVKLFPAELITPVVVKAMRAVLPPESCLLPVGGITPENMKPYEDAGANGFGIGSALYKSGKSLGEMKRDADQFVQNIKAT